ASAIATMIALRLMGDAGVAVATAMLTLVILIFAEVTPKTVAAIKPEQVAFPASLILSPLLKLLYPFVWLVNTICNGLLRMLGFNAAAKVNDHLSSEELRTIVHEAGALIPRRNQSMLLSILDLDTVTVEDIMIPRNEIVGIDINDDISTILNTISQSPHTRIPLYQEELNNVVGMVHVRQILPLMYAEKPSKEEFLALAQEPYFVPESTPLNTQLLNFQKRKYWVALVVDEYGDIQGLTTLEDILEEIVGDMAEEQDLENDDIHAQEDGSFFIDGTTTVRDINKALTWSLPIDGPKTLNGLITERLEEIPQFNVCLKLGEYHLETVQIRGNFIKTVRLHRVEVTAEEVH
ncbi:HlyC/CorC family transporter, partial [Oceanospirillaceae bacterium]|nr:HlyC/CorC family transporter [Oceanospirillaceae bacterium]